MYEAERNTRNFEESRLNTTVSFSEFLANPNLDVIYANEEITHGAGSGFGKSHFAFIYDRVTKQYCILNYATKSSSESAYGIPFEAWWNYCIAVETVYDIGTTSQKFAARNKYHSSNFHLKQTSAILFLMRHKSIKRSMKYMYSILNRNKKAILSSSDRKSVVNVENNIETLWIKDWVLPTMKIVSNASTKYLNTYGAAASTYGDEKVVLFHNNKNIGIVDPKVALVVNELHFKRPIIRFKNKILKFFKRKVESQSTETVDKATAEKLENIKGA